MNRTERLLDLIAYLLNAREPVSWQEIKNHFPEDYSKGVEESNQRKFERDKAELISLGIPIDYRSVGSSKKEGYVIEKDRLFLPETQFSPQESSLLMLSASAVLEHEGFPYRDQLESALHKMNSMHEHFDAPPPDLGITFSPTSTPPIDSNWVHQLQEALDRRKAVDIVYHAFSTGKTTSRRVHPYGLIFRRGNWTLVGWDSLRNDLRSFVVSRIRELKVNIRRPGTPDYEIPENFTLKRYQNQQPWDLEFHEPIAVTVQTSAHRLPELLPQLSSAERLAEDTFRLQVTNRSGLISWVLSHRTDVRVVAPPEMIAEIQQVLGRMQ